MYEWVLVVEFDIWYLIWLLIYGDFLKNIQMEKSKYSMITWDKMNTHGRLGQGFKPIQ